MDEHKKGGHVPELRFPGFEGEWEEKKLGDVAGKSNRRNRNLAITRVLTNSATEGVIDQRDYFDKDIAVRDNTDNYHIIERDEFVYNPRISVSAPVGPISRNKVGEGIMSPLYTIFKFHEGYIPFWEYYFQTSLWHPYLKNVANSGARFDRMNITVEDFFNMPLLLPSDPAEQRKIAECLEAADENIAGQQKAVDALREKKKGLMQQLFPEEGARTPRLRFPGYEGEWEEKKLGEICTVLQGYGFPEKYQGQISGNLPFCKVGDISAAVDRGEREICTAANYVNYSILPLLHAQAIPKGATVFAKIGEAIKANKRIMTGKDCLIDNNAAAVKAKSNITTDEFLFYIMSTISLADYSGGIVPSVNKSTIEAIPVVIPSDQTEQQKIAECLTALDETISAAQQRLSALKTHKKGLMQKLFPNPDKQ